MNFEEYRKRRRELFGRQLNYKEKQDILWASNSLGGEVGELMNEVKKFYRDDKAQMSEERLYAIISEGGDVLWYLFFFFENILEIPLDIVMDKNIKKLEQRYDKR